MKTTSKFALVRSLNEDILVQCIKYQGIIAEGHVEHISVGDGGTLSLWFPSVHSRSRITA